MSELINFDFNGRKVRVVMQGKEPWFVAADVCRELQLNGDAGQHIRRLDHDEKAKKPATLIKNQGGPDIWLVNEPGFYALVMRSDKPEAKTFRRWVIHDVLPALRQHGTYTVPGRAAELVPFTDPGFDPLPLGVMQRVAVCEAVRRHSGPHAARALWVAWGLPMAPEVTGTPLDKMQAVAELKAGGARTATIAAAHGVVPRQVQHFIKMMAALCEPVKQAMRDGIVNISQARGMSTLTPETQIEVLGAIIAGHTLREADIKLMGRMDSD